MFSYATLTCSIKISLRYLTGFYLNIVSREMKVCIPKAVLSVLDPCPFQIILTTSGRNHGENLHQQSPVLVTLKVKNIYVVMKS